MEVLQGAVEAVYLGIDEQIIDSLVSCLFGTRDIRAGTRNDPSSCDYGHGPIVEETRNANRRDENNMKGIHVTSYSDLV